MKKKISSRDLAGFLTSGAVAYISSRRKALGLSAPTESHQGPTPVPGCYPGKKAWVESRRRNPLVPTLKYNVPSDFTQSFFLFFYFFFFFFFFFKSLIQWWSGESIQSFMVRVEDWIVSPDPFDIYFVFVKFYLGSSLSSLFDSCFKACYAVPFMFEWSRRSNAGKRQFPNSETLNQRSIRVLQFAFDTHLDSVGCEGASCDFSKLPQRHQPNSS